MYPDGQEILVVIDDTELRERVARILGDEGFAVTAAAAGLAALRAVGARHYSLVVAATELPGSLDGATTVRQARARQPWLKALYIAEGGARPGRGNLETDDVISAPFERRELIGCTFELLQRGTAEAADLSRRARIELRAC
ncbi:MAG TPA: response regulator [Stellaceae bacterium]|jgi:DNA-binding response OmpR family regulator|nr:response regulator [Stellaceae bacterium]